MSSKDKFSPPKHLTIGGQKIKVLVKKDLKADDGGVAYGLYCYGDRTIELNAENDQSQQLPTLLHEAVHAALKISGVGELLDPKLEEAICVAIEMLAPNIYFKTKK